MRATLCFLTLFSLSLALGDHGDGKGEDAGIGAPARRKADGPTWTDRRTWPRGRPSPLPALTDADDRATLGEELERIARGIEEGLALVERWTRDPLKYANDLDDAFTDFLHQQVATRYGVKSYVAEIRHKRSRGESVDDSVSRLRDHLEEALLYTWIRYLEKAKARLKEDPREKLLSESARRLANRAYQLSERQSRAFDLRSIRFDLTSLPAAVDRKIETLPLGTLHELRSLASSSRYDEALAGKLRPLIADADKLTPEAIHKLYEEANPPFEPRPLMEPVHKGVPLNRQYGNLYWNHLALESAFKDLVQSNLRRDLLVERYGAAYREATGTRLEAVFARQGKDLDLKATAQDLALVMEAMRSFQVEQLSRLEKDRGTVPPASDYEARGSYEIVTRNLPTYLQRARERYPTWTNPASWAGRSSPFLPNLPVGRDLKVFDTNRDLNKTNSQILDWAWAHLRDPSATRRDLVRAFDAFYEKRLGKDQTLSREWADEDLDERPSARELSSIQDQILGAWREAIGLKEAR